MYRGKYEAVKTASKDRKKAPVPMEQQLVEPGLEVQELLQQDQEETVAVDHGEEKKSSGKKKETRKKKRITVGTIVFYSIWLLLIVSFFVALSIVMKPLKQWLVDFEASQPDKMSDQIFKTYFEDPDWFLLYELGGIQDTPYEGAEEYASYMDQLVGDRQITMVETSAGLTGGKRFIIRVDLGDESYYNFATFTMVDKKQPQAQISDWQLGQINIFTYNDNGASDFQRKLGYGFQVALDTQVLVNGVLLDDSRVTRTEETLALGYMPDGMRGYGSKELHVDGLLVQPQIRMLDGQGQELAFVYDEQTNTYSHQIQTPQITDEEYDTALAATKTYCEYMIGAVGSGELRECFDSRTQIYTTIVTNTTWMQKYSGYDFGQETISDFYRYSDTLYSARVALALNVTRPDGTIKEYPLDSNFFLEKQEDGWKVIDMTNVDVVQTITSVRVSYMDEQGKIFGSEMVDVAKRILTPPQITVPEGKTFLGWYLEVGKLELSDDGTIQLPEDYQMEPMTVYAMFGKEG